jgi:hypothetical protein
LYIYFGFINKKHLLMTGAVVTPVLHVHSVFDVLHQMRTPKLHDHHFKNPQKQELLIIINNKTINDALTYKTGTDGGEKWTMLGSQQTMERMQPQQEMITFLLQQTHHFSRCQSFVDGYCMGYHCLRETVAWPVQRIGNGG